MSSDKNKKTLKVFKCPFGTREYAFLTFCTQCKEALENKALQIQAFSNNKLEHSEILRRLDIQNRELSMLRRGRYQ
ncbi:MAG: hypothetical protein WB014_02445 [Methanosarcina sp.]